MDTWKAAKSPNYNTNKNYLYPYSELPYLGEHKLVRIPLCVQNLIKHIDYLGEGRKQTETGTTGFPDCYNVHYEYQLIRTGPDKGRRIPNRIPFISGDGNNCCTRNYIKDNSVLTVTTARHYFFLSQSCVQDISRIVNSDFGKVIVYGYKVDNDQDYAMIEILSEELKMTKQLFYCPIYILPENLQLTGYTNSYRAYLSLNELKKEFKNSVTESDYEGAIILTGCLSDVYCCNALGEAVDKLLNDNIRKIMVLAYKLWNNKAKDIVCKYFPSVFKLIFNGNNLTIVNKKYNQALKLEGSNGLQAWGDSCDKTCKKLNWKIVSMWEDDNIIFNICNVDSNMYLQLDPSDNGNGDKHVWGSKDSKEIRYKFTLEPVMVNGEVAFTIINCEYGQRLMLAADIDSSGDRAVLGRKDVVNSEEECFMWIIEPWNQLEHNDKHNQSSHNCIISSFKSINHDDI